jgi:PRC-barrel domain protein
MITQADLQYLNGSEVYAADGGKIGSAGRVYLDDRTGAPEWVSVRTGASGTGELLVPLGEAVLAGDRLHVPFDRDRVEGGPRIDGDLGAAEKDELDTYYGLGSGTARLRRYAVTEPVTEPILRNSTPEGRH